MSQHSTSLWSPLRQPAFRGLWICGGIFFVGSGMQTMAAAWLMVELTGSSFLAALVQTAVFMPMFLLALPAGELEVAFFRCWTRKEAVLKACGTGLNTPLNSFCVSCEQQQDNWILAAPAPGNCVAQCTTATSDQWTSHDIAAVAAYQCSVAACAPQLEVLVHVM